MMEAEPDAETNALSPSMMLASEDSGEETSQEEAPVTSWNDLSIIERVGFSSEEMSEKDLEVAFSQISLAFRCDQYTLKQRLQAEEHARNLAEENVQLELTRGRETLETLKALCLDSRRSKILQRLELSLDILGGTVERISNTAEVLGAVHQEARVSRAVELMVAHVENLRSRHDRNMVELEEAKKMSQQQTSIRGMADLTAPPDAEECDIKKKSSQQISYRRRVSASIISSQTQERRKRSTPGGSSTKKSSPRALRPEAAGGDDGCPADDRPLNPDETLSEAPAAQIPPQPPADPQCLASKHPASTKTPNKSSPLDSLRQRHKGKAALSKKKAERDKKSIDTCQRPSEGTCGPPWRRPLGRWGRRCRWTLLCSCLLALACAVTLTYFLLEAS